MLSPDTSQQKHSLCELFQSPSDSIYFMSRNYFTVKELTRKQTAKSQKEKLPFHQTTFLESKSHQLCYLLDFWHHYTFT